MMIETAQKHAVETFEQYRALLFAIAYRMLGSVADAEDMVQEAFLRWQRATGEEVRSPKAWLTTTVTRLCIDYLRLARVRRETYVGQWLPEPLEQEHAPDPADQVALADSLSLAFLALLERLTPIERAVFLLHEAFDYDYAAIAPIVGRSEATCRQLAHRARVHITGQRPRYHAAPEIQERLLHQFARACAEGDLAALEATLAEDVTMLADGGGKSPASRQPVQGADRVSRLLIGIARTAPLNLAFRLTTVNGDPAFVFTQDGAPFGVFAFDIADERIAAIRIVVNPDKFHGVRSGPRPPNAGGSALVWRGGS
jgi:RNA polymerase sigma-70 factor, ECF subfamily